MQGWQTSFRIALNLLMFRLFKRRIVSKLWITLPIVYSNLTVVTKTFVYILSVVILHNEIRSKTKNLVKRECWWRCNFPRNNGAKDLYFVPIKEHFPWHNCKIRRATVPVVPTQIFAQKGSPRVFWSSSLIIVTKLFLWIFIENDMTYSQILKYFDEKIGIFIADVVAFVKSLGKWKK